MKKIEFRTKSLLSGILVILVGLFFAIFGYLSYDLGTLRSMGPGMFPVSVAIIMVICGFIILFLNLSDEPEFVLPNARASLAILFAILCFAVSIQFFGLAPAVFSSVVVSTFAEKAFRPIYIFVLSTSLIALSYVIFYYGIGLPVPLFKWGF